MSEYQRKELEEKIFCAKCSLLVEDTLLLTCEHNLCLPCAAENLSREESKNIHKHKTIVCDICFNVTILDNTTADELMNICQPQVNLSRKIINLNMSNNHYNINESLLNMSQMSKAQNRNLGNLYNSNKKEFCKDHGEELTYYCFDCLCRCICSECVVHGAHKNHDVMNVKRAYPLVVEKSEDLLFQVQNRIMEISDVGKSIEGKKRELIESTSVIKQEMAKAFEEIRIRLQKKEKEILDKTEAFLQEHMQEMSTYSRVIQSRVLTLSKLIDGINTHIARKDEVNLLNFFSENKNRIMQTVESVIPEIPDFNTIYSMKVTVNQNSFDSLINSLNAVHLEITSLKGFELNKVQNNTQKFAVKRDLYGIKTGNYSVAGPNVNTLNNNTKQNLNLSPGQFNYSSSDFSRNNNLVG